MLGRAGSSSGASEPPSSPRPSPPKVVVDDSPLQPAMGKHKESLKVKLMMRRPINQLVAQGIMPPLKTPPAYFEQCKQLERAKTGDLLKAKIQRRPDRQELERRHILEQESHVDPSLAEKQRMLKKARLADQLNDQLSHRPGPLELIKKNILHTEEDIETAVKSGVLAFKATSEGASGRPQHPSSYCGPPDEVSPSPSPPSTLSPASVASPPQHAAPGKDKNRKKSKQKQQPKARFKFHEYKGPPSAQKASSPPDDEETPYELLLQQQQLLLQLMLPASPASVTSDCSEHNVPPPPPSRFEDMKVSDLRAECKRRNLRVSGPKPQLIDRLRPFLNEKIEEPRSPASVASVTSLASVTSFNSLPSLGSITSVASPEVKIEEEDIVTSQRRQIEELERKLEASRQQLEVVRREAAGAAASDQSRRLLQAHICVSQLRAQLDALQSPPAPPPPPPPIPITSPAPAARIVLATSDTTPDRVVRLFTVSASTDCQDNTPKTNQAYILNGVKVVPIAILPTHYEPPAPPPPPPLPPTPVHDQAEDSQIMDDVLEILAENGELPSTNDETNHQTLESYLDSDAFSPGDMLGDDHLRESLAADELQRELDDIQNEIMNSADMRDQNSNLQNDLCDFSSDTNANSDDFFRSLLSSRDDAMDTTEEPERVVTPLTNGILDHRPYDDMDDLSLPSLQNEDSRPFTTFDDRPCDFDLKEFVNELNGGMHVDDQAYDFMDTEIIPNHFGRGHAAPRDPLLGGVLPRPAPRPQAKHYSWDKIEFDAT